MSLLRLVIFASIGYVLWYLVRKATYEPPPIETPDPPPTLKQGGKMVRCQYCGLHIPEEEAIHAFGGAIFCCEEHQQMIQK